MIHTEEHPLKRRVVKVKSGTFAGENYQLEDWWDCVAGQSWMSCSENPACLNYAIRSSKDHLPMDDNVVYGKIGAFGHLIHISELEKGNDES